MHLDTPDANPSGANYREIFADLRTQLPPLPDEDPETRAKREQRAMDAVACLTPCDAFEARLAVRAVAADAHAADALRSAALGAGDPDKVRQCRAQAASMARQSDAALRALLRIHARREKLEAEMHPAAMEKAGYWFKSVVVPPAPAAAETPPDEAGLTPSQAGIAAEADLYANIYPDRVARIRAAGGLPARLDFGPPEPEIVAALLRTRALTQPLPATAPAGCTIPESETMRHPRDPQSHRELLGDDPLGQHAVRIEQQGNADRAVLAHGDR